LQCFLPAPMLISLPMLLHLWSWFWLLSPLLIQFFLIVFKSSEIEIRNIHTVKEFFEMSPPDRLCKAPEKQNIE
jgi:hypothetical protein